MSKEQHKRGLGYKTITNKTMTYKKHYREISYLNYRLFETEIIINAHTVFYCINSVTICNKARDILYD